MLYIVWRLSEVSSANKKTSLTDSFLLNYLQNYLETLNVACGTKCDLKQSTHTRCFISELIFINTSHWRRTGGPFQVFIELNWIYWPAVNRTGFIDQYVCFTSQVKKGKRENTQTETHIQIFDWSFLFFFYFWKILKRYRRAFIYLVVAPELDGSFPTPVLG